MEKNIIECTGVNEVGMDQQQFYTMFTNYCNKEGQVVKMVVSGNTAKATVIKIEQ